MSRILLCAIILLAVRLALAAEFTLTVSDTISRTWQQEPIKWAVTCKQGEWSGSKVAVKRDGTAIPAQVNVAERFPDGSVKTATILCIINRLDKDATTTLTATTEETGPTATDLTVTRADGVLTLGNGLTAIKVLDRNADGTGEFSPILGVKLPSGQWTGGGAYATQTTKPTSTTTELIENGPVRLAARVTTTFANGRRHVMTIALCTGSRAVDIDEDFNLGPESMYKFKEYKTDRDELAWEWWSWYGDKDGTQEDHPNYWLFRLTSPTFTPTDIHYHGCQASTPDKGATSGYYLSRYIVKYPAQRRLEKYICPYLAWRPDSVLWYGMSQSEEANADALAIFGCTPEYWRQPDVFPHDATVTLRTSSNEMRVISSNTDRSLVMQCPIGLGHRTWGIRVSTVSEMYGKTDACDTAVGSERIHRDYSLDSARTWVTTWPVDTAYPRLFIKPKEATAYYARLKGHAPGESQLEHFLNAQTQVTFDRCYSDILRLMDADIYGYYMDEGPGWMMGYWNGIRAAGVVDNLVGHPLCTEAQAKTLRKKMAQLTYLLVSKNSWPDKQINFGWGSMNMPVGRWGGLAIMSSVISDHPMAKTWAKDAGRYYKMLLNTEYAPDGTPVSCPHYMGASITSFYAWMAMANSGAGEDMSRSQILQKFARLYMQCITPVDTRFDLRLQLQEGDGRPGAATMQGLLATFFRRSNPELAGQLMTMWQESGKPYGEGMGIPDTAIFDPTVPATPLTLGPEAYPGFGAFLRYRTGVKDEAYLSVMGGNFMLDHANTDQMAFEWYEKRVPLTVYNGSLYNPFTYSALSHNTLAWDVRLRGPKSPGKDQAGDWYHDKNYPYVEPSEQLRFHWEVSYDGKTQQNTEARGMITRLTDTAGAGFVEGQVAVKALAEVPTRANYTSAMATQFWPQGERLANPFTWTRRLLYVKAPTADGMNYLVVCDDTGAYTEKIPSFNYWALANSVKFDGNNAHFTGPQGIDTDLYTITPSRVALYTDTFTTAESEGDVRAISQQRYGKDFSETYTLARVEGQQGQGFLVVLFPRKVDEPQPVVTSWFGGKGAKVVWQGETHYIVNTLGAQTIKSDGITATAALLVVKVKDSKNYSITLPNGGSARFNGKTVSAKMPVELQVVDGKVRQIAGKVITPQ